MSLPSLSLWHMCAACSWAGPGDRRLRGRGPAMVFMTEASGSQLKTAWGTLWGKTGCGAAGLPGLERSPMWLEDPRQQVRTPGCLHWAGSTGGSWERLESGSVAGGLVWEQG